MLSLGIIGAGRLGSFHADKAAARDDVVLAGIYDPVQTSRDSLATKHSVESCSSLRALLTKCDAVVIAAPTTKHHSLGMESLGRDCHVLMEKPMAETAAKACELAHFARHRGLVLQVGHVEAFSPAWTALGHVGDMVHSGERAIIRAVRTSPYTGRSTDIGATLDMMIHDLDLVLSLIPSPIAQIEASLLNVITDDNEDSTEARLVFANGSVATFYASRCEATPQRTMDIRTARGSATIDFASRRVETRLLNEPITAIDSPAVDALALEMGDFVAACRGNSEPRVSGDRGALAVSVAEAIVAAAAKVQHLGTARSIQFTPIAA